MRARFYNFLTVPAYALLYTQTTLVVLIILPFAYLRMKRTSKYILRFWAKSIFWLIGKNLRVHGLENYHNTQRYIILANHASLFDIMAIMSFYPDVAWIGHARLMKVPVFNQVLKMIDYVPVKGESARNTRKILDDILHKSKSSSIAIFPEGTRTLDGNMNNFFKGFIYILRASDADVLPVTLNGFYSLKPKNRFHINFSADISVVINKPINSRELKGKADEEIITEIRQIIESGNL